MILKLFVLLAALLGIVVWIAWRYFLQSGVSSGTAIQTTCAFAVPRYMSDSAGRANSADRAPVSGRKAAKTFGILAHWPVWIALLLIGAVVGGVFAMSGRISLEPLAVLDLGRLEHIQSALIRENLVPPPPLPPSVFTGTDRPGLETADRDWSRLNPDFARRALHVLAKAEARGFPLVLLEGYRSPERQNVLADSAVHVTNARAFQSKHQYGMALDAAPLRNGRLIISERDPWAMEAYRVLGEEAEKAGLVWGGRWALKDFGHIETAESIAAIARNNETWRMTAVAERK